MKDFFKNMNIQRMDSNTRKEIEEDTWRKAEGEEKQAFLGYYMNKGINKNATKAFRVIFLMALFISIGELMFERLCKADPSYNPAPMIACIVVSIIFLLFNEIVYKLKLKKELLRISDGIYVTNALAYYSGDNAVQIMINKKRLSYDKYVFKESVSPMDYVYAEDGSFEGFRVLLYIVMVDGKMEKKVVLGNSAYEYYLGEFKEKGKHDDFIASANV